MARGASGKAVIVFKEEDFESLRSHLLKGDGQERAAFLFLGESRRKDGSRLFCVHRVLRPRDGDYAIQNAAFVEPDPAYVLDSFSAFMKSGAAAYLHAHSHPFSQSARFSAVDDRSAPEMIRSLSQYLRLRESRLEPVFLRIVWGRREDGFEAECLDSEGRPIASVDEIRVVGPKGLRRIAAGAATPRPVQAQDASLTNEAQFDRNIRWLGAEGQRKISETRLVVCGAGGVGAMVLAQARGLGFRRITIVDHDRVEESNLNRLVGAGRGDVGEFKADVMKREILRYDPRIEVLAHPIRVQTEEARRAILEGDVIVGAVDDDGARMDLQVLAARHLKPLLDLGCGIHLDGTKAVERMGGQVSFYVPGGPCLLCLGLDPARIVSEDIRRLRRDVGYVRGSDETPASVVTLNSILAAIGMDTLTKYLTGFAPVGPYLQYDASTYGADGIRFAKRSGCPICGDEGIEGKGEDVEKPKACSGVGLDIPENSIGAVTTGVREE